MSPTDWLEAIDAFLADRKEGAWVDRAVEALRILVEEHKRPEPPWETYPLGTSYYRTRMVGRELDRTKYLRELSGACVRCMVEYPASEGRPNPTKPDGSCGLH